jgi:hypothetical protein
MMERDAGDPAVSLFYALKDTPLTREMRLISDSGRHSDIKTLTMQNLGFLRHKFLLNNNYPGGLDI